MSDNPQGKDGLARNIARFKEEYKAARAVVKEQSDSHSPIVNACTEFCRHASFLMGHYVFLTLITQPLLLAVALWGWFR